MKPVSIEAQPKVPDIFWSWPDEARARVTAKEWRAILLNNLDRPTIGGRVRQVVARRLGYGVVELSLAPLEEGK